MDLHIDHLDCRYRTPFSRDEASIVQKRLDLIASNFLAGVWEEGAGYDTNDKIYFAESIEVDLMLDAASADDHRLARTWARELHKGVTQTLRYGGRGVVVYANRSEFLASFLGDLLRGGAWDKWYYHELSLLASKSTAQAASAALTAEPEAGRDALLLLTGRGDLDLLLATLGDRELELVVDRCMLPKSQRFVLPKTYARWADALRRLLAIHQLSLTNNLSRDTVSLYLRLLMESPELGPDVNLARFIFELLQLRNAIINLQDSSGFLRLVATEAWERAFDGIVDSGQKRFATELARELGGTPLATLLRALQVTSTASQTRKISTHYGGLFLLAPAAIALRLDRVLGHLPFPKPAGTARCNLLLYLISLQCLGGKNASQAARDSGVHLFAGLDVAPTKPYLDRYAETLTDEMHENCKIFFQRHLTEVINRCGGLSLANVEVSKQSAWFSLPFEGALGTLSQTLEPLSRTLIRLFASSLGAFGESSPGYLSRNLLECNADIEISSDRIAVRFLTCPLQMILRMAGFDHARPTLPWVKDRELHFRFD